MEVTLIAKREPQEFYDFKSSLVEVHHIPDKPCKLEAVFVHGGKLKKVFAGNHVLYGDNTWSHPGNPGIVYPGVRISVMVDLGASVEANVLITLNPVIS
jgi:hypothetical protein